MIKTLQIFLLLLLTSCANLGFYSGAGLGYGGAKAKGPYPYSSTGLSGTLYAGIPAPFIPNTSLNIKGDKIWIFNNSADIESISLNVRYTPLWFLSVEAGPTIGRFWRKMRSGDPELRGLPYESIKHSGKVKGAHLGLQVIPLNFIFQYGLEVNYYYTKSSSEKIETLQNSIKSKTTIDNGNTYSYYTVNAIIGLTF